MVVYHKLIDTLSFCKQIMCRNVAYNNTLRFMETFLDQNKHDFTKSLPIMGSF